MSHIVNLTLYCITGWKTKNIKVKVKIENQEKNIWDPYWQILQIIKNV